MRVGEEEIDGLSGTLVLNSTPVTPLHIQQMQPSGQHQHHNIYTTQPTVAAVAQTAAATMGKDGSLTSFRSPQQPQVAIGNFSNLNVSSSSSEYGAGQGARSSGDGGSAPSTVADDSNYATLTNLGQGHEDDLEEDSHYSLIRKPDGQADEPKYSTLRESDGGYESLQNPPYSTLGIDSGTSK